MRLKTVRQHPMFPVRVGKERFFMAHLFFRLFPQLLSRLFSRLFSRIRHVFSRIFPSQWMVNKAYGAWFLIFLAAIFWGSNFIHMKRASTLITAPQIAFFRIFFGFMPLFLLALATGSLKRAHFRHWPHFMAMGFLASAFYYYCYASAAFYLPSSISGLASGLIPLFTFLGAWLFLHDEPMTMTRKLGIVAGFAGVLLIARPTSDALLAVNSTGILWMIAGSMSVGSSFVYARRFLTDLDIPPLALASWQMGFSLLMITLVTDFEGAGLLFQNPSITLSVVIGLGFLGTGCAFIIYYIIIARFGAVVAASATYLPLLVALVIGVWIADERLFWPDYLAALIIFTSMILLRRRSARPKEK